MKNKEEKEKLREEFLALAEAAGPLPTSLMATSPDGDYLRSLRVPSFCPICELVMKGSKSTQSFYDWGCCVLCQIQWVEGREEKWRSGWRPDQEQLSRWLSTFDGLHQEP